MALAACPRKATAKIIIRPDAASTIDEGSGAGMAVKLVVIAKPLLSGVVSK
jgi:hypothetical protein